MAYDDEQSFHGYRYLVDANNSRQYALRFNHGAPERPLHLFAQDARHQHFVPNENIFALDDEVTYEQRDKKSFLFTTLYQFGIGADGNLADPSEERTKMCGVEYETKFAVLQNQNVRITYTLTAESVENLTELGFAKNFPVSFTDEVSGKEAGLRMTATGATVDLATIRQSFVLPPQHPGGATVARMNIQETPDTGFSWGGRQDNEGYGYEEPTYEKPKKEKQMKDNFNQNGGGSPTNYAPEKMKVPDRVLEQMLETFCKDLSAKAYRHELDPVVGRDDVTEQAIKVLSRRSQASTCFTGEAGTGKTSMFHAIAQYIADGKPVPASLKNARVMQPDFQGMLAGTKFRGEFEARIKPLLDGLQERKGFFKGRKIILAIDEIHTQLAAGGGTEGSSSVGQLMKPFLTAEGIVVMGTTTDDEYGKHIEKNSALSRRFEKLPIEPTDKETTKEILATTWPLIKRHHNVSVDLAADDINYIVNMTDRYAPNEYQPGKSAKVLDTAASAAAMRCVKEGIDDVVIERQDIIAAVSQMSKLPTEFLAQNDHERFLMLSRELPVRVLGQDSAIEQITDGLIGARSGLSDQNKPMGVFVLQGPTGVGKTETARALADILMGNQENLIRLDMAEYSEKLSISRLIGASPNYVGYEDGKPALTEQVRRKPYSILLLDEIEKAHPDIFNVLLPVFDDGVMTDNKGRKVQFNNCLILMTTNLGAREVMDLLNGRSGMSFGDKIEQDSEKLREELGEKYKKAAQKFFPPEMINRIETNGGFITFVPLKPELIEKLAQRQIDKLNKAMSASDRGNYPGVTLEVSESVKADLAIAGYNPEMGARPLERAVKRMLINPLGKWLMEHKEEVIRFAAENGGAKIVIESLKDFAPKLEQSAVSVPAPATANDNATPKAEAPKKVRKPKAPGL